MGDKRQTGAIFLLFLIIIVKILIYRSGVVGEMNPLKLKRLFLVTLIVSWPSYHALWGAEKQDWQKTEVDWKLTGSSRIKAIYHPRDKVSSLKSNHKSRIRKEIFPTIVLPQTDSMTEQDVEYTAVTVIESPPIDGFVPWIAVSITDDDRPGIYGFDAVPRNPVTGDYLPAAQSNFDIGLFDTGASFNLIGYGPATNLGVNSSFLTSYTVGLIGATGTVNAAVSKPLGFFVDDLGALEPVSETDPNVCLRDTSGMVGQSNVSLAVGPEPATGKPDLPTAIGTALSVYYAASFINDQPVSIVHNSQVFTGPQMEFYQLNDSNIPSYSNTIPLKLIPGGGAVVAYLFDLEFNPTSPSIIIGETSQSRYNVHSVNLNHGPRNITDNKNFLFDTGAQVSVISTSIAAILDLDPNIPDFEVEIIDVTGTTTIHPGYYIDSLEIPVFGDNLFYTNVPVILLDFSAGLDGIIGMNLFNNLNFVFHGGGMAGQPLPFLDYTTTASPIIGDIAPSGGDGKVNMLDLTTLLFSWMATPISERWNPDCDLAPVNAPDGKIDLLDFDILLSHWLEGTGP